MFDGSSIAGWKSIDKSDMKLMPDLGPRPTSTRSTPRRPWRCTATVLEPDTGELYERDPRGTAVKAEKHTSSRSGIGDTSYWGPEAEFFLFDDVRFGAEHQQGVLRGRRH